MKKRNLFILILLIVNNLFCQLLDNTKTMDLTDLYEAVENSGSIDAVMQDHWYFFANIDPLPTNRFEDEDLLGSRARYDKIDWADNYARGALVGAIGVDRWGDAWQQGEAEEYLEKAQDYLIYNHLNDIHYLNLVEVFDYLDDPSEGGFHRCLILGTLLYNVTTIADILYEYVADFSELENIVDQLASYADDVLTESRNLNNDYIDSDSIWPKSNGRIRLAGALGYAGIVLENDTYIENAVYDLFEWHHPAESFTNQGYLGAYINKSGVYSEGVTYWNFCMKLLTPFFTAYKRTGYNFYGYTDLFAHPYIKDTMENTLQLINPDLSFILNDDTWVSTHYYPNSNVKRQNQFSELVPYYYQSEIIQQDIRWIYEKFNIASINPWWNLGMDSKINVLTSYDNTRSIADQATLPQTIIDGVYSTSEYTMLRQSSSDFEEFSQAANLIVTHENSLGKDHEDCDQSGFYMYYKGVPLIIDPGYNTNMKYWSWGHQWLASPYAHNVIMANPNLDEEEDELDEYWANNFNGTNNFVPWLYDEPIGRDAKHLNQTQINNPCEKKFIILNDDITHLKVYVKYDHPQQYYQGNPQDIIEVYRNFYQIGNDYFIIYDYVHSSEPTNSNLLMNQLHLAATMYDTPDGNMQDDLVPHAGFGNYSYEYINDQGITDIYLHFTMGSSYSQAIIEDRIKLPQGIFNESDDSPTYLPRWGHRDIRLKTETYESEKFLTFLFPTEESITPVQDVSQSSGYYATKVSLDQQNFVYTGVNSTSDVYMDGGNTRFATDASFFLVDANEDFTDFNKFIVNSGDHLEIRDETGSEFSDVLVFESETGGYEEVSVSYGENGVCHISLITEDGTSPRCKILRNGCITLDENYLTNHNFIYYDDNFFYIDYDANQLPSSGITTVGIFHENLTISSTTSISNSIFMDDVTITVEENSVLAMTGINCFGNNSEMIIEGTLYIQNATLRAINNNWQGIGCNNTGIVTATSGTIIENADIGILGNGGNIDLTETTITNSLVGIALYCGSSLDFESSTIDLRNDPQAKGILNTNGANFENTLNITGTTNNPSQFIGHSYNHSGLYVYATYDNPNVDFLCEYSEFLNLENGIFHNSTISTDHQIQNCVFIDCNYGINIFGNGGRVNLISDCDFNNCSTGLKQNTATCNITNCNFIGNENSGVGIEFQNSQSGLGSSLLVDECNFTSDYYGILCSDSSPSINNSIFECSFGINNSNNSIVDIAKNAYNAFNCIYSDLFFFPDRYTLSSGIMMKTGHNDFWGLENDVNMYFCNYDGTYITIDASENWFEDFDITLDSSGICIYPTIYEEFDLTQNTSYSPRDMDNFEMALEEEYIGNYASALYLYKSILDQPLQEEVYLWDKCIDKIYNLTMKLQLNLGDLLVYYDGLFLNQQSYISTEKYLTLERIKQNYKKKCFIALRNYQDAADIIVERISNPLDPIDSLYAVMQLETIYALSQLDSTRITLRTSYDSYAPSSIRNLNTKHKDHWNEIFQLLGISEPENDDIIPYKPELYSNYPNPFNPETTISFSIREDSKVKISIYNIKGQKVTTLLNDELEKGKHDVIWKSKDSSGKSVASGVYFYKLEVNRKANGLKKMLLLK